MSFADDTTIIDSNRDIMALYRGMNQELEHLNDWFRANRLCLNVKKTKYILFSPKKSKHNINDNHIILNEQDVDRIGHNETEKSFKFLGIHIDETLSWSYHIEKILKSSNYISNKFTPTIYPKNALLNINTKSLELWNISMGK